jgi:hypothetical protein
MNWQISGDTLGVISSGTWVIKGQSDTVTTPVLGNPSRTETFTLEVTNSATTATTTEAVTVENAMDLSPNGAFSLVPQGDSFPLTINMPTGSNRGLFVLLTWFGMTPTPTHAQLGTTLGNLEARTEISTSLLTLGRLNAAIYYFSEADLQKGATNNQLRFSNSLVPYVFPDDWAVHLYRATNVGSVTAGPNNQASVGSTVTGPVINMTQFSSVLSLSVAVGTHTATATIGTDGSTSGGSGDIRSLEAIPNASGQVQITYQDNAPTSPRVGYCYVIVDPV